MVKKDYECTGARYTSTHGSCEYWSTIQRLKSKQNERSKRKEKNSCLKVSPGDVCSLVETSIKQIPWWIVGNLLLLCSDYEKINATPPISFSFFYPPVREGSFFLSFVTYSLAAALVSTRIEKRERERERERERDTKRERAWLGFWGWAGARANQTWGRRGLGSFVR